MSRPGLELADIFRKFGNSYRLESGKSMLREQFRAMRAIELCRTPALGGHIDKCDQCGLQVVSYNSCRNRHCPKCQSLAKAEWLEARCSEVLPVSYFHVVFTVPDALAPVMLQNKKATYGILFKAASQTLLTIAADPEHLGAKIGFMAILHTWGQTLMFHPHIHCVVPGGGLSADGKAWVSCRDGFFLPVRVLSRLFRGLFLSFLKKAREDGNLKFLGKCSCYSDPDRFNRLMNLCYRTEWVVYSKPPFGSPAQVLDYLGRYTHRVAITNHRLLEITDDMVSFRWRDYSQGNRERVMTLHAHEFIRRFLLHILPPGFVKIRYYGFLANRQRARNLKLCRELLQVVSPENVNHECTLDWKHYYEKVTGLPVGLCPSCQRGHMATVRFLAAFYSGRSPPPKEACVQ